MNELQGKLKALMAQEAQHPGGLPGQAVEAAAPQVTKPGMPAARSAPPVDPSLPARRQEQAKVEEHALSAGQGVPPGRGQTAAANMANPFHGGIGGLGGYPTPNLVGGMTPEEVKAEAVAQAVRDHKMPPIQPGRAVRWFRDIGEAEAGGPHAPAIVIAVHNNAIDCSVLIPNAAGVYYRGGVRHATFPDRAMIDRVEAGVWDYTLYDKYIEQLLIQILEAIRVNDHHMAGFVERYKQLEENLRVRFEGIERKSEELTGTTLALTDTLRHHLKQAEPEPPAPEKKPPAKKNKPATKRPAAKSDE